MFYHVDLLNNAINMTESFLPEGNFHLNILAAAGIKPRPPACHALLHGLSGKNQPCVKAAKLGGFSLPFFFYMAPWPIFF